jgi:arylsulfatase A-like enzyme
MKRIAVYAFLTFAITEPALAAEPIKRPNIVVILADDQGWGDLSLNGNPNLRTPHIDSLARDGARFDRFFVQPVCSPTRAEFLTGRWHPRGGVHGVSTGAERLDIDEQTIADAFRAAGYATACFGKWHNGSQYPYHPNGRGFAEYYGFTSGHWGEYFNPLLEHNGRSVRGRGYITDDLTDRAIAFLTENGAARRPFFCYLAFNTPHSPMQVPDEYWRRFENATLEAAGGRRENRDHTRAALAMCENVDANVGRVLDALRKGELERDTIVLYFSDNGPNGPRWNGGMKGIKGSTDEGGVRSPLVARWPARIRPGTVIRPVAAAVDLYPTLIDLCSVGRAGDKPFDGMSLAPWLLGQDVPMPARILFQHWGGNVSARNQRFRLDGTGQLFDLTNDPQQQRNVAVDFPEVTARLSVAVDRWRREVLSELPKPDDRPFPVGFIEFPRAVLPARDGVPHAGVARSAPAPNCSFFTHWTSAVDRMTWDIDVHTAGRYEAIIHYTCTQTDAGSEIELAFGRAKWSRIISEPYDPPLRGKERDRVTRQGESYVKDFRPLSLGVVELGPGKATLTLRATKVAARQVADVRAIELILRQ